MGPHRWPELRLLRLYREGPMTIDGGMCRLDTQVVRAMFATGSNVLVWYWR